MNQGGFILTEFLIAVAIASGLTILTFAMTFTLSTVEVVQYIVYSTSRAHAAANYDQQAQQDTARKKYQSLAESKAFKFLFTNGWFEISKPSELDIRSGSGSNFSQDYALNNAHPSTQGVRVNFTAKLLEMQLPMLGSVTPEDSKGFTTRVNALLIREVSMKECQDYFQKERPEALWGLENNRFSSYRKPSVEAPWEDNGC